MLRKGSVFKCSFIFIMTFALRQIMGAFSYFNPSYEWFQYVASLMVICIFVLFIRAEGTSFRDYGFLMPEGVGRYFWASLFLASCYVLVVIFLPGSIGGFEAFPPASISLNLCLMISGILLSSIAAETVFRGYIQTNLANAFGFSKAVFASSIMFTLYMLSYAGVGMATLFYNAILLFAESVFLCLLFRKTRTLLCTVTFNASITLLYTFTPLRPIADEYVLVFSVIPYVFLALLLHFSPNEKVETEHLGQTFGGRTVEEGLD